MRESRISSGTGAWQGALTGNVTRYLGLFTRYKHGLYSHIELADVMWRAKLDREGYAVQDPRVGLGLPS
jgi:hypothetical protein